MIEDDIDIAVRGPEPQNEVGVLLAGSLLAVTAVLAAIIFRLLTKPPTVR